MIPARWIACLWLVFKGVSVGQEFVNFETAPVHPLALSPDGNTLAVCNLPDNRVELFDLRNGAPRQTRSIFTGLDPVTARFNGNGELWVVNHISDSITIIDVGRQAAVATIECFDAPADVVFTKNGEAYVSHAGARPIKIFDAATRNPVGALDLFGNRAKAMAISRDGAEVYVAFLESGNGTTIIGPKVTGLGQSPGLVATELPGAPHQGLNPSPNAGNSFSPPINTNIPPTIVPQRVGVIVRKQGGRWMDDNQGDWTEFISGTNAPLTGRKVGWDLADHDVAVINTADRSVRYVQSLMNICFDVAVNPASGKLAVIGSDAINEIRFEPVLQSIFARMKLAVVDPTSLTASISDLNPHLDYIVRNLPKEQRRQSIGDPRSIAWNASGTRAYIAGMGSNNILMVDENGARVGSPVNLPAGPVGLVVDDRRGRVYVLSRFEAKLVTLDVDSLGILNTVSLHDSTPSAIRIGRKHFYDTIETSGLGQVSCATCHVDGRFDRLAWDLGDPASDVIPLGFKNFELGSMINDFHPMKGPMVTQTLQDVIGHEPFHWRSDRMEISEFKATFKNLQGADEELSDAEMAELRDFFATITFPPNPYRNPDNSLPSSIELPSERAVILGGLYHLPVGTQMPDGNPRTGLELFLNFSCRSCHTTPTGLGTDAHFSATDRKWVDLPIGVNGEHHLQTFFDEASNDKSPFKIPQLRSIADKVGFDQYGPLSRAGTGFMHDGRASTLTSFLLHRFSLFDDNQKASDMAAFLMAFGGGDLPLGSRTNPLTPPGVNGTDVPAGVGHQVSLTTNFVTPEITFMIDHARSATSRVDLVVHNSKRGWLMESEYFLADQNGETNDIANIVALAAPDGPLIFTFVPRGSGRRIALDRDGDGFFNFTETNMGSDPADPNFTPDSITPRLTSVDSINGVVHLKWWGRAGAAYQVQHRSVFSPDSPWLESGDRVIISNGPATYSENIDQNRGGQYYRIVSAP